MGKRIQALQAEIDQLKHMDEFEKNYHVLLEGDPLPMTFPCSLPADRASGLLACRRVCAPRHGPQVRRSQAKDLGAPAGRIRGQVSRSLSTACLHCLDLIWRCCCW
jgi:hypothetical protein